MMHSNRIRKNGTFIHAASGGQSCGDLKAYLAGAVLLLRHGFNCCQRFNTGLSTIVTGDVFGARTDVTRLEGSVAGAHTAM